MRLRAEAKTTANKLKNLYVTEKGKPSAYKPFSGKEPKLTPNHLKEFGRMGYVTDQKRIKRKEAPRGIPMLMVGYAEDHPVDCYRMYNPNKDSVVISRGIQWAKWTRSDPIATLKAMQELKPLMPTEPKTVQENHNEMIQTDDPTENAELSNPHIIPEESDEFEQDVERNNNVKRPNTRSQRVEQIEILENEGDLNARALKERKRLNADYNPAPQIIEENLTDEGEEDDTNQQAINVVMSIVMLDPGEPNNLNEALSGPKSQEWTESIKAELNNCIA
jgi:hypothetical protein